MDRNLRQHIAFLEKRLQRLNWELTEKKGSLRRRNHIQSEIRAVETALEFYRRAREIEVKLSKAS